MTVTENNREPDNRDSRTPDQSPEQGRIPLRVLATADSPAVDRVLAQQILSAEFNSSI